MCGFVGNRKSRVTGDAAVGEEVGRVGENHVEHAARVLGEERVHDLEAVTVVEPEAAGVVAVGELRRLEDVGAFMDDGVLGTELGVVIRIGGVTRFDRAFPGGTACGGVRRPRPAVGCGLFGRHALIGSIRARKGARLFNHGLRG